MHLTWSLFLTSLRLRFLHNAQHLDMYRMAENHAVTR
jgi:hypothetical protein